jgi:hypothetical protein
LLLGIPIYVFVFAIYYSVSALAGLIWRNATVSIAVSILFWASCFGVGTAKIAIEEMMLNKRRIVNIIPVGEDLIAVNEINVTFQWNEKSHDWVEIFEPVGKDERERRMMMSFANLPTEMRPIGPVYDSSNDQLVSALRSMRDGQMLLHVGRRSDQWKKVRGANGSMGTVAMLTEPDGKILIISSLGLFRIAGDPTIKPEPVKPS